MERSELAHKPAQAQLAAKLLEMRQDSSFTWLLGPLSAPHVPPERFPQKPCESRSFPSVEHVHRTSSTYRKYVQAGGL